MLVPLISEIRDFLHDSEGDRWTDKQILTQIDRAQKDLVNKSKALKFKVSIGLRDNVDLIELPDNLLRITRVDLNGCKLDGKTHQDMDRLSCSCRWETLRGTPRYYILDKTNRHQLRLSPIPDSGTDTIYQETSVGLIPTEVGDTTIKDKYGISSDVIGIHTEILGFGTMSDILLDDLVLEIHYDGKPKLIDSIHNSLDLDNIYESAIKHYVCGHLLRNDRDSESRSLGGEELQLYREELRLLKKDVSLGFTDGTEYSINYRRF